MSVALKKCQVSFDAQSMCMNTGALGKYEPVYLQQLLSGMGFVFIINQMFCFTIHIWVGLGWGLGIGSRVYM